MGYTLVAPQELWGQLKACLLADQREHLAFLLARPAGKSLLAREVIEVPDTDLEESSEWGGLSLKLRSLIAIMNEVYAIADVDPNNVLATSWSYGGYIAHYMANRYPERFSCIAV